MLNDNVKQALQRNKYTFISTFNEIKNPRPQYTITAYKDLDCRPYASNRSLLKSSQILSEIKIAK